MNARTGGDADNTQPKEEAARRSGVVGQRESLDAYEALLSVLAKWARATKHEGQDFIDAAHGASAEPHDPIVDAEHLLTFLLPQNEISHFTIPRADSYFTSGLESKLGMLTSERKDPVSRQNLIFHRVLDLVLQYFVRHLDEEGRPLFGAGAYVRQIEEAETTRAAPDVKSIHFTEAYSFSLTLCVLAMSLSARVTDRDALKATAVMKKHRVKSLEEWRKIKLGAVRAHAVDSDDWVAAIQKLERDEKLVLISDLAGRRLTDAMKGLIASFSVSESDIPAWEQRTRRRWSRHQERLHAMGPRFEALGYANWRPRVKAVECGWSWGPIAELPQGRLTGDRTFDDVIRKAQEMCDYVSVHAENAPYFYFTISALDSIADLGSEAMKVGELLSAEQSDLANRLSNLADLTRKYWSELAFGGAEEETDWPVASLPWSPSDTDVEAPEKASSAYWNLYLLRIAEMESVSSDRDIGRLIEILNALSDAARITSPAFPPRTDPAIRTLHIGMPIRLHGQPAGGKHLLVFERVISDFAPQLLKVCGRVLEVASDNDQREAIVRLSQSVWAHLLKRTDQARHASQNNADWDRTGDLSWDDPTGPFDDYDADKTTLPADFDPVRSVSSWSYTERVVEALVAYNRAQEMPPASNAQLKSMALSAIVQLEFELKRKAKSDQINKNRASELQKRLDTARRDVEERAAIALGAALAVAQEIAAADTLAKSGSGSGDKSRPPA